MKTLVSRLGALALAVLLPLLVIMGVLLPVADRTAANRETIAEIETQIAAFRAHRGQTGAPRRLTVQGQPLIVAESETLAAARLQALVERTVSETGGTLESRSVSDSIPFADGRRLPMVLDLVVDQADLQALLHRLEAGTPYLFIDRLDIRRAWVDDRRTLAVRIALHALMPPAVP